MQCATMIWISVSMDPTTQFLNENGDKNSFSEILTNVQSSSKVEIKFPMLSTITHCDHPFLALVKIESMAQKKKNLILFHNFL